MKQDVKLPPVKTGKSAVAPLRSQPDPNVRHSLDPRKRGGLCGVLAGSPVMWAKQEAGKTVETVKQPTIPLSKKGRFMRLPLINSSDHTGSKDKKQERGGGKKRKGKRASV